MSTFFTFKHYIENYDSGYTTLFKQYFTLDILPNRVCSSKCIYNILLDELRFNSFKQKLFRETFSEYFKLKITSQTHLKLSQEKEFVNR